MSQKTPFLRFPTYAGSWYPQEKTELVSQLEIFLSRAEKLLQLNKSLQQLVNAKSALQAIVVPHAGYLYSGKVAAMAYQLARSNALKGNGFKRIILLGPSHRKALRGIGWARHDAFSTPLGMIPLDQEGVKLIADSSFSFDMTLAHQQEHSLELQLPFIRHLFPEVPLLPLLIGGVENNLLLEEIAQLLEEIAQEGDLLIVSSDFLHYGPRFDYLPFFPLQGDALASKIEAYDLQAYAAIAKNDWRALQQFQQQSGATICGIDALLLLLYFFEKKVLPVKTLLLERATSQDQAADPENSVSYLSLASFIFSE